MTIPVELKFLILRGGGWDSEDPDRSVSRSRDTPSARLDNVGFRASRKCKRVRA